MFPTHNIRQHFLPLWFLLLGAFSLAAFIPPSTYAVDGDPIRGKELSATCVACHGSNGNSLQPIWPNIAGQHADYIQKQLMDFQAGKRVNAQMSPIVANLSEQDMKDLAVYYSGEEAGRGVADPSEVTLGETLFRAGNTELGIPACMACHSPNGRGVAHANYPSLSGQHAGYTLLQLKNFKAEERQNDSNRVMRSIAGRMTNAQMKAVAEYIQGLY